MRVIERIALLEKKVAEMEARLNRVAECVVSHELKFQSQEADENLLGMEGIVNEVRSAVDNLNVQLASLKHDNDSDHEG